MVSQPSLGSELRMPAVEPTRVSRLHRAIGRVPMDRVRASYLEQDEFIHLERFLRGRALREVAAEVEVLRPYVRRKVVPLYKKSGSVSYHRVLEHAPAIAALYHDPVLIDFFSRVAGAKLVACPVRDPHACALYYYTEPGDHIGYHLDSSHYEGARYTALIGLVDRSSSRLMCELYRKDPSRDPVRLEIATTPGTLVFFDGGKLWHSVSPLGVGEERVVLTLEYVTDTRMTRLRRFVSDLKDAMTYFGFAEWLRSRRRPPLPAPIRGSSRSSGGRRSRAG